MDSCTSSGKASRRHRAEVEGRDGDVEPSSAFNDASVLRLTTSICASALTAAARGARRMDGARSSDRLWLGRRLVNQQVNSSANLYKGDPRTCVYLRSSKLGSASLQTTTAHFMSARTRVPHETRVVSHCARLALSLARSAIARGRSAIMLRLRE